MMKLDAWDKKILTLLQRNNRLSQREIADRISLSPSAVNRRIAALEDAGVIKGSVREGANKQVISSQADSLIKISRIWADFFPA
ncbi:Lrp/AsnC family transcriptional regulator, partial [Klebsiella pneumoniae]|nr:Lrp/AsnC family transcriptional regulator [Klebsiella pneumoniae]